jgi:tRNA-intron lyase
MFSLKPARPKFKNTFLATGHQEKPQFSDTIDRNFLKTYTAYLQYDKIIVKDEAEGRGLYRFGYFGKGEFSRSEPTFNDASLTVDREPSMSLEFEDIRPISRQAYCRQMEWSSLYRNKTCADQANDFHSHFLAEYVADNIKPANLTDPRQKCRININDPDDVPCDTRPKSYDRQINPFGLVITDLPDCTLIENLCLSYEEAFYLSYALGCLRILKQQDDSVLTNLDLWKHFSAKDEHFISKYIVYHKLRSEGWILKSGIKYGTDFLVYYKGPEYYHSSFSIIVKQTDEAKEPSYYFANLFGLIRVNETVSKVIQSFCAE